MAMSALHSTNITHSLRKFSRHGGETDVHADGWGVAYYDGHDVNLLREPRAAAFSSMLRYITGLDIVSNLVIAHIREANVGKVGLCNTHPFTRELAGRQHSFAHNGQLPSVMEHPSFLLGRFRPIGVTDSEFIFCILLNMLEALWEGYEGSEDCPSLKARVMAIAAFSNLVRPYGPSNFIYSDGDCLFIHSDQRLQTDGVRRAPALHVIERSCSTAECFANKKGICPNEKQKVTLVSTIPLSNEKWRPLDRGEIIVVRDGSVIYQHQCDIGDSFYS